MVFVEESYCPLTLDSPSGIPLPYQTNAFNWSQND